MTTTPKTKPVKPRKPKLNKAAQALEVKFARLDALKIKQPGQFDPNLGLDEYRDR
jgi:hypothetical protein